MPFPGAGMQSKSQTKEIRKNKTWKLINLKKMNFKALKIEIVQETLLTR